MPKTFLSGSDCGVDGSKMVSWNGRNWALAGIAKTVAISINGKKPKHLPIFAGAKGRKSGESEFGGCDFGMKDATTTTAVAPQGFVQGFWMKGKSGRRGLCGRGENAGGD